MRSKLIIAAAVVALGLFALTAAPALAGPGGRGGGKGGGAKIWSTQNGVAVTSIAHGTSVDVQCSGAPANKTVWIDIFGAFHAVPTTTDRYGNCASVSYTFEYAGWSGEFVLLVMTSKGMTNAATSPTLTVY